MKRLATLVAVSVLAMGSALPAGAGGATKDTIRDFETVVAVAYADNEFGVLLMFADCAFLHRVELPDGSAKETQSCQVTRPFDVLGDEFAGELPTRAFADSGGECIWFSDYWINSDPSVEIFANSYSSVVTPSGRVHATSHYAADPLTPEDCGS